MLGILLKSRIWRSAASCAGIILLSFLCSAPAALAQTPTQIPFQGLLLDPVGTPINDSVDLGFELFDQLVAGSSLWSESHLGVIVVDGVYSVNLGEVNPITQSTLSGGTAFLEITVGGETLVPRQQLLSVPYALVAESAENIGGASAVFYQTLVEQFPFDGQDPPNLHPDEGIADVDGDGQANFLDVDNDDDGIEDAVEVTLGRPINVVDPTINSVTSTPSPIVTYANSTLTVEGLSLETISSVSFGPETPTAYAITPTSFSIDVTPLSTAASETLMVTLANGQSASTNLDLIQAAPTVDTFSPRIGVGSQAHALTIIGSSFVPGMAVQVDGQSIPSTLVSDTELTITMPATSAGISFIRVTHPNTQTTGRNYRLLGPDERVAFATAGFYTPIQIGAGSGLDAAHAICQLEADQAGLVGVYHAWLSISQASPEAQSPSTTFPQNVGPYYISLGLVIANDWTDLTDGTLERPINFSADGSGPITSGSYSWTGTEPDGTAVAAIETCSDWTTDAGTGRGRVGSTIHSNIFWTDFTNSFCSNARRLYCFQQ